MKKKLTVVVAGLVTIALMSGVGTSLFISLKSLDKLKDVQTVCASMDTSISDVKKQVQEEKEKDEEVEVKDPQYVTIGEMYEIRDYSNISDAYINGVEDGLTDEDKETLKMASEIIKKQTTDKMSIYEKEVAIYNWMRKNIGFNDNSLLAVIDPNVNDYTPYGVLKGKNAVCVGYATTFKLFMNMLGLECQVVHSTDLSHSWDVVKLDDEQWYLVDVFMDGGTADHPSYSSFNCTSASFRQSHTWDENLFPIANGIKYSYAVMHATDCKSIKDIPKMLKNKMDKEKGKSVSMYLRLIEDKIDQEYLSVLVNGITSRINNSENKFAIQTMTVDENGKYVLGIIINDYSEKNDKEEQNSEAKYEGLTEQLNDLFGNMYSGDSYENIYDCNGKLFERR